jgi:hypothetical protein
MMPIVSVSYVNCVLYLSVCGCCFAKFCIVFRILKAIFICMSLNNFITFLVSFPLYVKVAHSCFRCYGSVSVFCLRGAGYYMILFSSYLFLPVTVAARSRACTVFARSEAGTVGSNSTQGMDV